MILVRVGYRPGLLLSIVRSASAVTSRARKRANLIARVFSYSRRPFR